MLKVMIAEDDLIIADMLEEVLADNGYEVTGIARTVDEAVKLGERTMPDLAVVDLRLAEGGLGSDIPARLHREGKMGVLYATGNLGEIVLTKADGEASLGKPYRPTDVIRALEIVEQIVSTGAASQPFPKRFQILQAATNRPDNNASARPRETLEDAKRILRQQAALAKFGSFAFRERDIAKVLTEAARVCAEGLDVPFCKVCRYRPAENDLLVEAGVGWHEGVLGCVVSRADETSPQGRAFITKEPVICADLSKDATYVLPPFYAEHGIISTIDVVIIADNEPYGVLEIDSPVQQNYDQHDIDFLTGFANIVAGAVTTSHRSSVLERTVQQMKEMVADRDRLLVVKNRVLEERGELLDEKNRLLAEKNVLAQELQHRVRNNLQLVYGMLNKQLRNGANAVDRAGIDAIARRVMTLAQVYDHLLGAGLSRTIDFGTYLSSLCAGFKDVEDARHPGIDLTCRADSVILDLDSVTALGLIIAELISNGYEHAFTGRKTGTIKVSLHHDKSSPTATITFADDGVGFEETGDSKRHGLGLLRRLVEQIGGAATLKSDHGTVWTIDFPVAEVPKNVVAPSEPIIIAATKAPSPVVATKAPTTTANGHGGEVEARAEAGKEDGLDR